MPEHDFLIDGAASGTALNTTNLKATDGTPAVLVSAGAGGTITADNSISWNGLMGMKVAAPSTSTSVARFPVGVLGTGTAAGRLSVYRYCAVYPTSNMQFAMFMNSAGTILFRYGITTTGHLFIGASVGTGVITEGQVMRYEVTFNQGTSTTTGSWTINAYVGDTNTVVATITQSAANLGYGTQVDRMDLGTGVNMAITQWFFAPRIADTLGAGELGPYVPPPPAVGWHLGSIAI